jgi:hypothetical protein
MAKSEEDGSHIEFKKVMDGSWRLSSAPTLICVVLGGPGRGGASVGGAMPGRSSEEAAGARGCACADGAAGDGELCTGCDVVGKEEGHEAEDHFFLETLERIGGIVGLASRSNTNGQGLTKSE